VPGRLVRAGRNVIAVRVHSNMYQGGMTGPAKIMAVAPAGAPPEDRIGLAGEWRFQVEHNFGVVSVNPPPPPPGEGNPNTPTALHNGMIAPVAPYGIRGAIWYQGESNAGRPAEYRTLFPAMIRDWRRVWGQGDFPFYFVQLANYMPEREQPVESQWAELREAQRATLALPQTGQAVIIDIGEANDIHPRNKQDVGKRLALIAQANVYGQTGVPWSGPVPRSARRQGSRVRVAFDHAYGGLIAREGALKGFAIAGEDRVFEWAEAQLVGADTVALQGAKVTVPHWVRYAWADNPVCNLYNEAGLPASPFELAVER
jgi:sialate O-acetylesterase